MCSKNAKIRGFLFYFNLQQNLLHTLEAFSYRNVLYSKYCTKRLFFVLKRRGNKKYKYKLNGSKMAVPPAAHRRFCLYRFLTCTAPQAQSLSKTAVIYFQLAFWQAKQPCISASISSTAFSVILIFFAILFSAGPKLNFSHSRSWPASTWSRRIIG